MRRAFSLPKGAAVADNDLINYIGQAATARGIDPVIALKVAQSEGLNSYVGDSGSSFGPFQLHYGGIAGGGNSVPGLGDDFTAATGKHASDPSTVKDQIDFALDHVAKNGWGDFHGAATLGIKSRQGIGKNANPIGVGGVSDDDLLKMYTKSATPMAAAAVAGTGHAQALMEGTHAHSSARTPASCSLALS